jgi:hypothetical protein
VTEVHETLIRLSTVLVIAGSFRLRVLVSPVVGRWLPPVDQMHRGGPRRSRLEPIPPARPPPSAAKCAGSHGPSGEGDLEPALVGVADRMTAAEQIAAVVDHTRRLP